MTTRIVAIGTLVALLGVVAASMAIALIGSRDGPPSADTGSTVVVRRLEMGRWTLEAQLALASTGAYELGLRFVDEGGAPASTPGSPTVRVSSLDHDMEIASPPIEPVAIGSYRAVGSLAMEGRWRFQIEMAGNQTEMVVTFRK